MSRRQPDPPTRWLMTDERVDDTALMRALERLPRGAGVVFRHYTLAPAARRRLFERVRVVARRRGLILSLAGTPRVAAGWRADGVHGPASQRTARPMLRSMACHDGRALIAARRAGITSRFVSPVYPTRSHPGRRALGIVRLGLLIGSDGAAIVALGGMNAARGRAVRSVGVRSWAAIDAWLEP